MDDIDRQKCGGRIGDTGNAEIYSPTTNTWAKADGIAAIVDGGHADMNRSVDALKRISTESGLPIIASGGYYMQRSYPADLSAKSVDQ